jgi:hypothetical protein
MERVALFCIMTGVVIGTIALRKGRERMSAPPPVRVDTAFSSDFLRRIKHVPSAVRQTVLAYIMFGDTKVELISSYYGVDQLMVQLECRTVIFVLFSHICVGTFMSVQQVQDVPYLSALFKGQWSEKPLVYHIREKTIGPPPESDDDRGATVLVCTHPVVLEVTTDHPRKIKISYTDDMMTLTFFESF